MIKYETTENKYLYDPNTLEQIIKLLESGAYYDERYCTQENVTTLVNAINIFLNGIKQEPHKVIKERHETEAEAREYFGQDFINTFDNLLTALDKQKTMVALHGTNPEICQRICETGLQYKLPSLSGTAVQQSMAYEQHDMHYENYESLLNWGHKEYKGLVILAIPYECYYKEGLWNHFQKTDSSAYGGQDYRIDPDFVVGYIDVENKKIVINPKYNRQHNYEGYVKDNELFKEKKEMDNDTMQRAIIESEKAFNSMKSNTTYQQPEEEQDDKVKISEVPYLIEELTGTFNSVRFGYPNGMTEDRYKYLLEELSMNFRKIQNAIPQLKTNAQVEQEEKEKYEIFDQPSTGSLNANDSSDFDWDWGENIEWEETDTVGKSK